MTYVRLILLMAIALGIQACGGNEMEDKAEKLSTQFCDCLQDAEIDNPSAYKAVAIGSNETLITQMDSCSKILKADLLEEIESYKEEAEQTQFLKVFIKTLIDSECGVQASKAIPYDALNLLYEEQTK